MAGGDAVGRKLRAEMDKRLRETRAVFTRYRFQMEAHMRKNAAWSNITGEARRGLTALTEFGDDVYRLVLTGYAAHTVFLELAHAKKYQIIRPTIEEFAPRIIRDLRAVWR